MNLKKLLFWQPRFDLLRFLNRSQIGKIFIVIFNYAIWFFLFFVSYLLIKSDTNIFWQLLIATIVGEVIEKYGKSHALWRRPLYQRNDATPTGLVDRWYKTGSFPSGHTIKAMSFLLFLIQYPVFPISSYLLLVIPLIFLRVLIGFHYPFDLLGGAFFGLLTWLLSKYIVFPEFLTEIVHVIFNFVFLIRN
ncbi:phosphatase PAP2 family protein [Candidatus Shapirobacteria bacterium]|nr:phosphatase PAP2 family protein [Candidatus Shapirobacteria bacterium]